MELEILSDLLGGGPINTALQIFAVGAMVLAIGIWIMEFAGWTISRRGFVRNNIRWNAQAIALIAVCAAIYIAARPLQIQFVPGIGGFNPSHLLAPVLSVLFGLPGAVGVTFSMPIGDALTGQLTLGSVAGFLSHTYVTWLVYKMVPKPSLRTASSIASFYLWAVIITPLIHSIVIPGWLDLTNVLPPAVAWGIVTPAIWINHGLTTAVIGGPLLFVLYPWVRQWGLFHGDQDDGGQRRRERSETARAEEDQGA